ncbi:MAG: PIN domain-containing protein [Candidatus Omnitrophica bacterium]|nr:PIN domain-containing protein [Candidatus Omnitrophota bacterium]MBU4478698.1 PIN domain-containing protein [Candidatus Omnitrophota bacterium]
MKILTDTCIWSQVLRHKNPNTELSSKLNDLIQDGRIVMIGPIRQELLSGISNPKQFHKLKKTLSSFEDTALTTEHFEKAAEFCNICRINGIQGSTIDFLICAVSCIENFIIFTTDSDFKNYRKYLPIKLLNF